jgi:hypothetical protein
MGTIAIILVVLVIFDLLVRPLYAVTLHPEILFSYIPALFIGGVILYYWCTWRYNFFYPEPKEYNLPLKEAFAKIRDYLAEVSYHYGDKWRVVTADTRTGHIVANLQFTEEEEDFEGRTKRVRRFLRLDIRLMRTDNDTVTVQIVFESEIDGLNFLACDSIVSDFCRDISASLQTDSQQ